MMSSGLGLVSLGWAASLAQPGGNITGFTNDIQGVNLTQKQLSLLKDVLPNISRVAHLWDPQAFGPYPGGPAPVNRALSLQIHPLEVHGPEDLEDAFEQAARAHDEALVSTATPMLSRQRERIAASLCSGGSRRCFTSRSTRTPAGSWPTAPAVALRVT